MPTLMPVDNEDNVIPAVRLKTGGAQSIAAGAASVRSGTDFAADTRIVSVYATAPVYLRFGDVTATASATDHYFPGGLYYDFAIGGGNRTQYTRLAALAVSGTATVYISEKE